MEPPSTAVDASVPALPVLLTDWFHIAADDGFFFWAQNTPAACITFGGPRFTGDLNPQANAATVGPGAVVGDGIVWENL